MLDGRFSVFQAGTTTPAPAYKDAGFGARHEAPIPALGSGIWPIIFLQPGAYDFRVTDTSGNVYSEIGGYVIDAPSSGEGGSGGDVDDKRLAQTDDIKDRYGVGSHPGWVRMNGRTIGSAASSASERANDDCQALYSFLWTQDPNLAVSGGRGANAAADWAAAKTIALPDHRGRSRLALDDLGNAAAGRLNGGAFYSVARRSLVRMAARHRTFKPWLSWRAMATLCRLPWIFRAPMPTLAAQPLMASTFTKSTITSRLATRHRAERAPSITWVARLCRM